MKTTANLPIAIFDSGVGGLTVFRAIRELLPNESLLYLGDTARVPYGVKSHATIVNYTVNCAEKLLEYGAKMLVIACNTATAAALPTLTERFSDILVIGVIRPGAKAAVEASRNGRIAVIATEATIRGNAYQAAITGLWPQARVISRACTLFVSLAEEGWLDGPIVEAVACRYLADIFPQDKPSSSRPDTLLLGCTHFPLLKNALNKIAGSNVKIVDSATATAKAVLTHLRKRDLLSSASGSERFLTTDNRERFARAGSLFLKKAIAPDQVELVDL